MKLTWMAMTSNRLARDGYPSIVAALTVRDDPNRGGGKRPRDGGTIFRIPAISALGKAGPN